MTSLIAKLLVIAAMLFALILSAFWLRDRLHREPLPPQPERAEATVTIQEGLTLSEIAEKIDQKTDLASSDLLAAATVKNFQEKYQFLTSAPKSATLEGYLFPDTYRFFVDTTADEALTQMLDNTGAQLAKAGFDVLQKRICPENFPTVKPRPADEACFTIHDLITLASIIELETGGGSATKADLETERRTVAGIFLNRLGIGQALQSDATVNYITKAGLASPTIAQTQVKSPYNTYLNPGLPPGPIGAPGLISLKAVLRPIKTDYFYFLHIQPSGEVVYGKTFEEHVANKFKYLK